MTIDELITELQFLIDKEHESDSSSNMPVDLRREYDGGYYNGVSIVKWELILLLKEVKRKQTTSE